MTIYFGSNIRKIREQWKLSQTALAKRLDLSRQQLGYYESSTSEPSLETIVKIVKITGFRLEDLYDREILESEIPSAPSAPGAKPLLRPREEGSTVQEAAYGYEPLLDDRALRAELQALRAENEQLRRRVAALEQKINPDL